MLTLFTGAPGAGKTAQMVAELAKLLEREPNRPIYCDGVNGLVVPHTPIDASRWHEELPDGALMLVDEAQRLWRPTGPGQKPGADITSMETHRHRGIDIWMTTQGPRLIHQNVRALIGRHIHLRDTGWLGRWWYEWPECNEALAWRSCPVKFKHSLPKSVFDKYKSASLHIKPSRRFPTLAIVAIVLLVLLAVLAFLFYRSISSKTAAAAAQAKSSVSTPAPGQPAGTQPQVAPAKLLPIYVTDPSAFTPRWDRRPESAPAYDELLKVKAFPRIVAGICYGAQQTDCRCLTQQGTDSGLNSSQCRDWIAHPPFDPYREPEPAASPVGQPAPERAAGGTPS